jgi:hypothetical protein
MSNHWHGVVSDPLARLPEFLERFHRLFARAQNASLGRWENLWSSDKPSVVALVSDEDVLDKMAYTVANPTAAGLVRSPREWPGVITTRLGERHLVARPDIFFDPEGDLPDEVTLEFVRPPIYPQLATNDIAAALAKRVEQRVRDAREAMLKNNRKFLGWRAVLRQPFVGSPRSTETRRNPNPRIAARHTPERIHAIGNLLSFVHRYRAAWIAWRGGARDTVFPMGTYSLRIGARVTCGPPCAA